MRIAGAVDIGATTVKIGLVAEDGTIITRREIPTSANGDPVPLVEAIAGALRPFIDSRIPERASAERVGVSVAGFLDRGHESMIVNPNLAALCEYPLRSALTTKLGLECRLEVDSNAAVVAEYRYGTVGGARRLLGMTVGTGLGGGVMIDGDLLRFTGECAGDVGHILVAPEGRQCTCGARGCLEAMVCTAALSARAGNQPARDIIDSAAAGDRRAIDALAETGWWLGLGLAALSPVFSPDTILIGGGIGTAGDLLLEPVRVSYRAHAADGMRERVQIVGSSIGGWAGMIGAASLALDPLG